MSRRKSGKYVIPIAERQSYYNMVKRANSRIKSNIRHINKKGKTTQATLNQLLGKYARATNWEGKSGKNGKPSNPFHFRVSFDNVQEYESYIREVKKWGGETALGSRNPMTPANIRKRQQQQITKTYMSIASHYDIKLENGNLPKEMRDKIKNLSDDQLFNFYGHSDPEEDAIIREFDYNDVVTGDTDSFRDSFNQRIAMLEKFR